MTSQRKENLLKMMKAEDLDALGDIEKFLREYDRFFIGTHIYPDGDNVGSSIALKYILDRLGKTCYQYCESVVPDIYAWLIGSDEIKSTLPDDLPEDFDAFIFIDSADMGRIGPRFDNWLTNHKPDILNIDHHITNPGFGKVNWVCPEYSSTGEQILELLRYMDLEIPNYVSTALFTSMYTDTGRFSYSNTSSKTLQYATELVADGVVTNQVYRNVFATRSLAALKLETAALRTIEFDPDLKLAYVYLTFEDFEESGAKMEESEGIIEHIGLFGKDIRNILFFKQTNGDNIKVSVRCKGEMNAAKISMLFGGGGHPRAGGFSLKNDSIINAINESMVQIRKAAAEGILHGDII